MQDELNFGEYEKHYSEDNLFKKILKYAKAAGIKVVYLCLLLYYALQNPEMPTHIKATIIGALGYFVLPLDLIPDITPIVGYGDDLAVLTSALVTASLYIDGEVRLKAKKKLVDLFGEYDEKELRDIDNKI